MTNKEEIKIIEEISKEIIKRGRLLYSYEIKEILDRFITETNEDTWTPITEGQPKLANESYLVTLDYDELGLCIGHRIYFGNDKWDDPCVIAWQPLPEPYKKEVKNDI